MKQLIDIDSWNRKNHFNFFNQFDNPYFGITVDIDCTKAYQKSKELNTSFFIYYLHKSITAANNIEAFRYRIINNKVYRYDAVDASPTINRENSPFGFSYIKYHENFDKFSERAKIEIKRVQNSVGLNPATSGENVIHYSSLPWINFTALSHAQNFSFKDSCPKISFGKMVLKNGKKVMPMSVHVHHALMDGYEVGLYIDKFQELMND